MAEIKSFRGILYNNRRFERLEDVMSPPYDVISPLMQDELYKRNLHNVVRLILAKEKEKGKGPDNKYKRSARVFREWQKEKILLRDKRPSIYVYSQEYLHKGKKIKRTGFIALMKIENPKKSRVLPHEYTLAKPKEDRLNLIKEVKANLSPIFSLYQDPRRVITKKIKSFVKNRTPFINIELEGVIHKLWRIENERLIAAIKREMKAKKIFIADGHHRYEVALFYRDLMKRKPGFNKNLNYTMMYFTNLSEESGVTILSSHRLIKNIGGLKVRDIINRLKTAFVIKKCENLRHLLRLLDAKKNYAHLFGLYGKGKFYLLKLKNNSLLDGITSENRSRQWKRLDVIILHRFIMDKLLGLKINGNNIKYVKEPENAVKLVNKGEYRIAFFLNPVKIAQLKNVALKKDIMPEKSTYFYPKLLTGLVMNKF